MTGAAPPACGGPERPPRDRQAGVAGRGRPAAGTAVAVVAMVMIPCLCWLFLAYNRPEFLDRILTIVACVAGGYGWARGKTKSSGGRCA